MAEKNKERFTAADFFVGTICALIIGGRERFPTVLNQSVHRAFLNLFENELQEEAEKQRLDIRFPLKLNRTYGTSQTVTRGLIGRIGNILSMDISSGTLRAQYDSDLAERTLLSLPGAPDMYKRLATRFEELLCP